MSSKNRSTFCRNLVVFKLTLLLLAVMVFLSIVAHQYVSNMAMSETPLDTHKTRTQLDYHENEQNLKPLSSYQFEIEELKKIKTSVKNELRGLENRRLKLQSEISGYASNIDSLKLQQSTLSKDVNQIRLALDQIRFEQEESKAYVPNIKAPHRILQDVNLKEKLSMPKNPHSCKMESCFDFSRCSLVSGFPVYFYDPYEFSVDDNLLDQFILNSFSEYFENNVYRTREPSMACIFVFIVGEYEQGRTPSPNDIEDLLQGLPHWNGDGRNHVLINLARSLKNTDIFGKVSTGRAIRAQSAFLQSPFREQFDVLIPPAFSLSSRDDVWKDLPPISPLRRKFLLTYWGQFVTSRMADHRGRHLLSVIDSMSFSSPQSFYSQIEQAIVSSLKGFQSSYPGSISVDLACTQADAASFAVPSDWALCGTESIRKEKLLHSTFSLMLPPLNASLYSSLAFQARMFEALKFGSIPVILGSHGHMPFDEILGWESATITLPIPRVTELPFFLQSIPDEDLAALRLKGRHFYENFFSSTVAILDTVLALLRTRLQIPAKAVVDETYTSAFPTDFTPLKIEGPPPEPESDEILGPVESPFPSEKYHHNFTQHLSRDPFNHAGDPFTMYPYIPFGAPLPSESKFLGSNYGFRPVAQGAGGDGVDFSQSLGGNFPREQFTVVMLTYDRDVVLLQALARFRGLPFLNKVLVVWNSPEPPASDLRWPDIGVPIQVVKTKKNSLNNRFLPYDSIETEAVLSIDDDAHLRHDEIVFGFRVWREERSRVVGFPGRFHAWDAKHHSWNYNSNYSCELSMVLTGAAFFHKYYAYMYSNVMPQAIRDKVDEFMNCEDIAMNFLVAHISRRPPVKVTSRWTFRCPGCPTTLSSNSSHFEERHQCINFFNQVYGYMPLLYTQFRVDSVLFKTRISHDKSKCFKYI